jgi:pSer/pThr/pTyr-binding forkhead associated (FHA) protein/tetratricopeptide (TPR) repeat protein
MLRLVIEDDEGKQTVVPLIRDEITIGRQEGNTIRLTERNVSRRHARLLRMGAGDDITVIVEDLDSYNGIKLNGERVTQKCTMRPGDLIQIGDYALALQTDRPAARAEQPEPSATTVVSKTEPTPPPDDQPTALHRIEQTDQLEADRHGRLVVVSSNLAGQSYTLDQREIIIGRTDENDVVVNHRSISRNHAKVIFRDNSFTIIDLASSNGVKVNGEEFGTVSLVSGDIIELGHVKLRFVAPGEDYVFTPADVEDVEVEAAPGTGRLILIGLLLVGVAVGAFFLVRGADHEDHPGLPGNPPSAGDTARAENPVAGDVNAIMAEGRTHLQSEEWREAANVFGRVLQSDKDNAQARELRNQANREAENQRRFNAIRQQVEDHQWAEAWFALEDFPKDSVYAKRLEELRPSIEKGYADAELERGKALAQEGQLAAAAEVQAALAKRPFAKVQADALAKALKPADHPVAIAANDHPPAPASAAHREPRAPRPPVEAAPAPAEADDSEFKDLMARSLTLIANGQREEAAQLLERARTLHPEDKTVHQRLCAIYKPLGKLDKALTHCKKWLALEKNGSYRPAIEHTIQQIEDELGGH